MGKRGDPIRALEAAYDLDPDPRGWLSRLVEAAESILDDGRGLFGWLTHGGSGELSPDVLVVRGGAPGLPDVIREIHLASTPELARRGYEPGANTLLERLGREQAPFVAKYTVPVGGRDTAGLVARDASGAYLVVGSVLREVGQPPQAFRSSAERVTSHLNAALRLRMELSRTDAEDRCSAVLTPEGRVEDARGAAKSAGARSALRDAVLAIERSRGPLRRRDPEGALSLWKALVEGRWSVVDRFDRDGRRYLVAMENALSAAPARRLSVRERQVLAEAATGKPLKIIAYDLGLSVGAVTAYLSAARAKAGFRSRRELVSWFATLGAPKAR